MSGTNIHFDQLHAALMALMHGYLPYEPMGWEPKLLEELEFIREKTTKRGQMQIVVKEHARMCEIYIKAWTREL